MKHPQKNQKGFVCILHRVYTKDLICVFISELNKYAILEKEHKHNWYILSFTFRKIFKGLRYTITTFNAPPHYWQGSFIPKSKLNLASRRSFSRYEQIVYFEGFGQIPKKYILSA